MLLTKADQDEYWILPGGRGELGEDTRAALQRELAEETGHEAQVGDLLWVVENFFHLDGTDYHELAFTYAIFPKPPQSFAAPGPTGPPMETPASNSAGLTSTTSKPSLSSQRS